jgi:hypothetical protein
LSPNQTAAPRFPNVLPGPVPLVTLVNLTTMDPHMQNAHSTQASVEIEHQIGTSTTVSAGYQYVRGDDLVISINQNVPVVRGRGHEQRVPARGRLRQQQPVLAARALDLSRDARVPAPAARALGVLPDQLLALEGHGRRR